MQIYFELSVEKKIVFFHIIVSHKIHTVHCIFECEYFGITKTAMFHSDLLEWPETEWCESLKLFSCGVLHVQYVL